MKSVNKKTRKLNDDLKSLYERLSLGNLSPKRFKEKSAKLIKDSNVSDKDVLTILKELE